MSALARHWLPARTLLCRRTPVTRLFHVSARRADLITKYANKLEKKAEEKGLSVEELQERVKQEKEKERQERLSQPLPRPQATTQASQSDAPYAPTQSVSERKDSSPVKPLASFFNLPLIMSKPHTVAQISALWTAYHTRTKGFVCAAVEVDTYNKMVQTANKYPTFLLPLPRPTGDAQESEVPHEFFFMQWNFHGVPPPPTSDVFSKPAPPNHQLQTSTVIFTPLQEYKLRQSFATPYLVLTHYTDLAESHGVVLLRGEITPSASGAEGKYMLNETDAQVLSVALQKFYLWKDGEANEGAKLLSNFHERPEEFKWEELIKHSQLT